MSGVSHKAGLTLSEFADTLEYAIKGINHRQKFSGQPLRINRRQIIGFPTIDTVGEAANRLDGNPQECRQDQNDCC